MAVKVYKGGRFRPMSGTKVYNNNGWVLLSGDDEIKANSKWYKLDETPVKPNLSEPLTIYKTAKSGDVTVTLKKKGTIDTSNLYYRYGTTGEWQSMMNDSGNLISLVLNETNGDQVQIQNLSNTFSEDYDNYLYFSSNGNVGCKGNIQSLLNYSESCLPYCFNYLFENCNYLTEADNLILPATTLADYCYQYMFRGCKNLTKAPELPATTLADYCYEYMFYECSNLNYIKVGFTSWYSNTTTDWVSGVASTGTFVCPEELSIETGTSRIPEGWITSNEMDDSSSSGGGGGISEGYTGKVGFKVEEIRYSIDKYVFANVVEEYRYSSGEYGWEPVSDANMPDSGEGHVFDILWQDWFKEGLEIDCVYSFSKGRLYKDEYGIWYQEIILGKKLYLADEE